ncbi:MAG: hypothetical protein WBC70_14055 [Candidatus Aminicenantales bacterium]
MKFIIPKFIPDIERDQNAAGHADGQTGDVDEGIDLGFFLDSQSGF